MRRKRLKHAADILCQMFCGWRLSNCKPELVKLGSGKLTIDALSGNCQFNGVAIPELSIANEIKLWLREDMERSHISMECLTRAALLAMLNFDEITWHDRKGKDMFFNNGGAVKADRMHRCVIDCESEITTNESVYKSHYHEVEEWPIGWPSA
jgi:hypothetical protein